MWHKLSVPYIVLNSFFLNYEYILYDIFALHHLISYFLYTPDNCEACSLCHLRVLVKSCETGLGEVCNSHFMEINNNNLVVSRLVS